MDEIKNKITDYQYNFLKKMEQYIDQKLIFFGSVTRIDFIKNKSDIDVAILSDNVDATLKKLQNFLHIKNSKIRKSIQKFHNYSDNLIYGYKINYDDEVNNLYLEILINNKKDEKVINEFIKDNNNIPFYITIILYILKIMYYYLNILSYDTFRSIKHYLMGLYFGDSKLQPLITIKHK